MEFFGIRLVGITPENGRRLLLSVALVVFLVVLHYLMRGLTRLVMQGHRNDHVRFWSRQAINLVLAIIALLGLLSIWFEDPTRLTTDRSERPRAGPERHAPERERPTPGLPWKRRSR